MVGLDEKGVDVVVGGEARYNVRFNPDEVFVEPTEVFEKLHRVLEVLLERGRERLADRVGERLHELLPVVLELAGVGMNRPEERRRGEKGKGVRRESARVVSSGQDARAYLNLEAASPLERLISFIAAAWMEGKS